MSNFLEEQIEALRTETRKCHETIQEMKGLIREAKEIEDRLRTLLPTLTREQMIQVYHEEIDEFKEAMREHRQTAFREADKLMSAVKKINNIVRDIGGSVV